jgi:hypothetical protein
LILKATKLLDKMYSNTSTLRTKIKDIPIKSQRCTVCTQSKPLNSSNKFQDSKMRNLRWNTNTWLRSKSATKK